MSLLDRFRRSDSNVALEAQLLTLAECGIRARPKVGIDDLLFRMNLRPMTFGTSTPNASKTNGD
jgi:hypothetical protein